MTKQEEIREGMAKELRIHHYKFPYSYGDSDIMRKATEDTTNLILKYLHSQGVVLKADKELTYSVEDSYISPEVMEAIKKAGYGYMESLIKE